MPTDSLVVIILVLAVFGFFMAVLGYASFMENARPAPRGASSAKKRHP